MYCISSVVWLLQHIEAQFISLKGELYALYLYCCSISKHNSSVYSTYSMHGISIVVYLLQHIEALYRSLECVLYVLYLYCCVLVAAFGAQYRSLDCVLYVLYLYCCVLVAAYRSTNLQGIVVSARIIFQPILTISLYRSPLIWICRYLQPAYST